MSEKPVASIKTLARYEPDIVYIGTGEYVAECVRADDGDYYLAADVDAATEALRAEVGALREALSDQRESWQRILTAEARGFTVGGYAEGTAQCAIARIDSHLASGGEGGDRG